MSVQLKDKALRLFNKAKSQQDRGLFEDSLKNYLLSLDIQEKIAKSDPVFNTWIAATLNNLGALLSNMGKPDNAKNSYERALKMYEVLLEGDPGNVVYQSDVAMTLNNLGALLSDMGKPDDAKNSYERALKMREALLEGDPGNVVYQSDVAATLNNLGALLSDMGKPDDAKNSYERALKMYEALLEGDRKNVVYQSNVAATLNNLGALLSDMGKPDDAKNSYERALKMREALLEGDRKNVVYQSNVATTLNNLGVLLSNMGKPDDAKNSYERALKMREALLEGDWKNVVYQSNVATTLNNLGLFMEQTGNFTAAKKYYEDSLGILKEPLHYMTIKAKSRAIINLIQLLSKEADRETNLSKKQGHFKEIYEKYLLYAYFFDKFKLEHEKHLAKETGLTAHIHYVMLSARNETDADRRIDEYEKCIQEVKKIDEDESDEKLRELWSSVVYYLEGRLLINKAILSDIPDKELIRKAVEKFGLAKERYKNANVCHCIYSIILEIESAETLDDNNVPKLKEKLRIAIDSLPEKMDYSVISAFKEIDSILDSRELKHDPERFRKINRCIAKIDYSALRENFSYILEKLESYRKEPFNPNIFYSNGILTFRFDDPEKIKGKLTITAGERILFDEPLGKRNEIKSKEYRKNPPLRKEETIVFKTQDGKSVTRQINLCDNVECSEGDLSFHTILHDCKRGFCSNKFTVAIVQLKYHLSQENQALIVKNDEKYFRKVIWIMDEVKNKADLIVFPEFSIPFEYLSDLQKYSDDRGIVIIAGSHYVTDNNLIQHNELFADKFEEKDLLKNISPIIIPNSKILHSEKILGAKIERPGFSDEGMTHGELNRMFKFCDDVTCGIMICYDFMNQDLRSRITDACNLIIVPQTNPGTKRFHNIVETEISNPAGSGTKAYVMASGLFTFGDKEEILGGDSGVVMTLDNDTYKKQPDSIIKPIIVENEEVKEEFIQLANLNMNFNSARDTQEASVPITYKLIHIFERNEILKSKKENPEALLNLIEAINSCNDRIELKKILESNVKLIQSFSPLWHQEISGKMENQRIDQIKDKCQSIIVD
jgi:tetratricopeptide (TPR) repeat protein